MQSLTQNVAQQPSNDAFRRIELHVATSDSKKKRRLRENRLKKKGGLRSHKAQQAYQAAVAAEEAAAQHLAQAQALYDQVLPRLQFRSDLPQDVMLKIQGGVGLAWHWAGCVSRSWRDSIKRARELGCFTPRVAAVRMASVHSAAVTEKGEMFTWGDAGFGKLGHAQCQVPYSL